MKESKNIKWIVVAVVAAAVAAATTVAVLVLRARAKRRSWYEAAPDYDYEEMEDLCDLDTLEGSGEDSENEEETAE